MDENIIQSGHFCFTDRELSWLEFNMRVLREAGDKTVPLFERLKFLSIHSSNLEEFFMVRVGTLIHRSKLTPDSIDEKTGWTADTQIKKILSAVGKQQNKAEDIYKRLIKDMSEAGIDIIDFEKISKVDESMAKKFFSEIKPLLSPSITDATHPLPFLSGQQPYVLASLEKGGRHLLGVVALFRLPKYHIFEINGRTKVILMTDLVRHFSPQLFKKYDFKEATVIKVTRNADILLNSETTNENFRSNMERLLKKRKREQPVRLVFYGKTSEKMAGLICEKLKVSSKYVYMTNLAPDLSFGSRLGKKPGLVYEERKPVKSVLLKKGQFFKYLEKNDILLSFPYQSVTPFIDMIYEAADDPEVTAIKITLYRLAAPSKLAAALCYAADKGKDVLCLLELRARFDEQNNIDYSEMLEGAGCRIIYGLPGMKVHSKVCLITRQTSDGIKYITQIGTGNYNEVTSEQYTDLSLITSDKKIGMDAEILFDALLHSKAPDITQNLIIAPNGFKPWLFEKLNGEIAKGADGKVVIKVNSMNDTDVMEKLIECSKAGVKVELFIRGICCLRPGISGYTDNITIKSVVGRHLEHSRIYAFGNGDSAELFIGSGDLLKRNTTYRIEVFAPVLKNPIKKQIFEILDSFRNDHEKGSEMLPDGKYIKRFEAGTSSQDAQYKYFSEQIIQELTEKKGLFSLFARLFSGR